MYARAKRGIREDVKLYVVAVSSLTVAFLCLATALLGVTNLSKLTDRWGRSHRMSVYLEDGSARADVQQLKQVLTGLPAVESVEYLSAAAARERFLNDAMAGADLESLPPDVFPASLEVTLASHATPERASEIAERVAAFGAVQEVETYHSWFERLGSLLSAGKTLAALVSLLVLVCVVAVVGNTIRLAVASRRDEIEMLKMCGATDGFVRGPFVLEGLFQGLASVVLALVLLTVIFFSIRTQVDATLVPLAGVRTAFLSPLWMFALVFAGAAAGALGSALSIRRYLSV